MESMYNVDYKDLRSVAEIIYCFMTSSELVKPECTIWNSCGVSSTIMNDGASFMTEKDLFRKIIRSASSTISCVAATDQEDTRRAVLTYSPGLDFMVLNFPQANGRLNTAEIKIVDDLGKAGGESR